MSAAQWGSDHAGGDTGGTVMSEILHIPAGVIQPRELLTWLRDRRNEARETAGAAYGRGDEEEMAEAGARADAFSEVIQHIQFGGAS
jgi:hypothetical protein